MLVFIFFKPRNVFLSGQCGVNFIDNIFIVICMVMKDNYVCFLSHHLCLS